MATNETSSTGPRGPYAKTSGRQDRILDAAIELFASKGFRHTSLRDVAARASMSEAGLRHHFPSKTSLLEAVLERREADDLARRPAEPGAEVLRTLLEVVEHNMTVPDLVALYTVLSAEATDPEHPAHEYFTTRYAWVHRLTADAFDAMRERSELREGLEPEVLAHQVIAMLDGLQLQWLLDPSVDMTSHIERFIDMCVAVPLRPSESAEPRRA